MTVSRETKINNGICLTIVALCAAVHFASCFSRIVQTVNILVFAFYAAAILIWARQIQRRLLQRPVRRYLTLSAALMLFWMAVRTLKYIFIPLGDAAARYMWYLYYVPLLFVSLFIFLSVLYIGKSGGTAMSRRWNLLYIPTAALLALVLTNDLHFLVFRFPGGLAAWDDAVFIRGPGYYAVMIWITALFAAAVTVAFTRCALPEVRRRMWLPVMPFAAGAVYTVYMALDPGNVLLIFLKPPEAGCFLLAAFMECLITAGFFPSNDNYGSFWNASSIGAGIMDDMGAFRYQSEKCMPVTPEQVRAAAGCAVILDGGNAELRSRRVRGGYGYWTKDISELGRLNAELAGLGDVLAEENAMLAAENKMAESRVKIEQQSRLCDSIARSVSVELAELDRILASPPDDEEKFVREMKYACILNAYVKRRSNLLFLSDGTGTVLSDELRLAFSESFEYIRFAGAEAYVGFRGDEPLPCGAALLTYELFEAALEAAMPGARAVLAELAFLPESLTMRLEINRPERFLSAEAMAGELARYGGTLEISAADGEDTEYLSLSFPMGGERA